MPTRGRPRDPRKEQFWRQTLQRFQRSRLSATRFCQLHQLPLHSFWAWTRTLRLRDQQALPGQPHNIATTPHATKTDPLPFFVPLRLAQAPDVAEAAPQQGLEVLLPNGLRLRLPPHCDLDTLPRLLAVLGVPSC